MEKKRIQFSNMNTQKTELQKYGHYLAYGVLIYPNFSLATNKIEVKPETELQKYGHYLAYGVLIYPK